MITRERDRSPRWSLDADAIVALRRAGLDTEAQAHADWARAHFPPDSYHQGMILAALGRHAEAWPYLERMSPPQTRDLFYWTFWDEVRDTPAFAALIDKLGIEDEYRKAREALARIDRRAATRRLPRAHHELSRPNCGAATSSAWPVGTWSAPG